MFGLFKKKKQTKDDVATEDPPPPAPSSSSPSSSFDTSRRPSTSSSRRSSGFGSLLGSALSTASTVGKFGLNTATSVGKTVGGVAKDGIKTAKKAGQKAGGVAKNGILSASSFVDKHAKTIIEGLNSKTTEGSTCNLALTQIDRFRRQAREGVVYTMNLPENASRDMKIFHILTNGKPWPCVTNIIEGNIESNTDKQNWDAVRWLCEALDLAHVADGIKNAAIELLSVKDFTNNLETLTYEPKQLMTATVIKDLKREPHNLYDPLMKHCKKSLNKIGKRLHEYYVDEKLKKKLGAPNLPLHSGVINKQKQYLKDVQKQFNFPSDDWYLLTSKKHSTSSSVTSDDNIHYIQDTSIWYQDKKYILYKDNDYDPNMGNRLPKQKSLKELAILLNDGMITDDTLVWNSCLTHMDYDGGGDSTNKETKSNDGGGDVSTYIALSKVKHLKNVLQKFPFYIKRQDSIELNSCLPNPIHNNEYFYFEDESIYIHVLRLTALTIDSSYQDIIQKIAESSAMNVTMEEYENLSENEKKDKVREYVKEYTFSKASIKGDARIRSKAISQEDHANDKRPRPAQNIDINRNCLTFDTPRQLLDCAIKICNHNAFGGGAARIKNGFSNSYKVASKGYHYRTLMLNLVYNHGITYGDLSNDPKVNEMWNNYMNYAPTNPKQPWCQWRKHSKLAIEHLKSNFMKNKTVKLIVETQLLLKKYKLGRDEMHLLYKVVRTDSDKALYRQFVGNSKSAKKSKISENYDDYQSSLHEELLTQLKNKKTTNANTISTAAATTTTSTATDDDDVTSPNDSIDNEEHLSQLLRNACVDGAYGNVETLLNAPAMVKNPDIINKCGKVNRRYIVKSASIMSHNMKFVWGFLGLPNAGKCYNCHKMSVNRICVMCHLCSNCASEQECIPCTEVCRWCEKNPKGKSDSTYPERDDHEHECCTPSKIQFCFARAPYDYPRFISPGLKIPKRVQNEEDDQKVRKKSLIGSAFSTVTSAGKNVGQMMGKKMSQTVVINKKNEKKRIENKDNAKSSLYLACEEGHDDIVELLLNVAVVNINHIASHDGTTPLIIASSLGHELIVRLLLSSPSIDVNYNQITDKNKELKGMSSLIVACHFGHEGIVRMLLNHPNIDINQPTNIKIICSSPNDVKLGSLQDVKIKTALTVACERGHLGIVRLLLQNNAKINLDYIMNVPKNIDIISPIFSCCENGYDQILELLINQLIKTSNLHLINVPTKTLNMTPLVVSCIHGYDKVASLLLDQKIIDVHVGGNVILCSLFLY
jgi:ankyrin repeat protein